MFSRKLTMLMLAVFSSACLASEELQTTLGVDLTSEENIARGFLQQDVHSDQVLTFNAAIKTELEFSPVSALFINAGLLKQTYSEYSKLSSNSLYAKTDYVFQTDTHFVNPIYTLHFKIQESDYDSELRDSTILSVGAKLLKRFTTRISVSTGLEQIQREADTNVFDIDTTRYFVLLDYRLSRRVSLYGSYTVLDGGSVSTITTTDPDVLAQQIGYDTINEADQAEALLPDDAFGGAASGQFAYQNDAQTDVLEMGLNYTLGRQQAVDMSVRSVTTTLDTGPEYENFLVTVGYLARF